MTWITFALLTALSWGVYGVILHKGRGLMPDVMTRGPEMPHASLKAFFFVCVAYAIIGVVAAILLKLRGSNWSFTSGGVTWSFVAGAAGAIGAFTLVLALGAAAAAKGLAAPAAVMPIVFGGAPVVNTIVAMLVHPPEGGLKAIPLPFIIGVILAATGVVMVSKFAPTNTGAPAKHAPAKHAAAAPAYPAAPWITGAYAADFTTARPGRRD
ncbi:hypothetical protein AYO49_05700 [Verrucomicrobiaceae bacterium SCGC AG-212-N21]|nr:hypothetical protein AYO49_05700 [Verrucomicrobiaceae bacterium SCGC AG-212-N21]